LKHEGRRFPATFSNTPEPVLSGDIFFILQKIPAVLPEAGHIWLSVLSHLNIAF